ncbi:MAG: DUF4124 domain-containing protein [Burkholderiales bacterium]|nr:DUF4124 domain-containing protein [Sulfuricellaceae bacterium]
MIKLPLPRLTSVFLIFSSSALWLPAIAHAEIYKYVGKDGRITYSNVPVKGAKKIELEPINTFPAAKRKPAPADFPSVNGETQKKRDDTRRKILLDELATEQKQLDEAKQALSEGEAVRLGGEKNYQKYLDRIQSLKDNVTRHEKNIEALRTEIANLK